MANLGLMGKLKISSELLQNPWTNGGVAWTNRANLGLMGKLKISFRTPQTLGLMGA